jgi:hypothetical protein
MSLHVLLVLTHLLKHWGGAAIQLTRQLGAFDRIDLQLLQKSILAIRKLDVHLPHYSLKLVNLFFVLIDLNFKAEFNIFDVVSGTHFIDFFILRQN